MLSLALIISAEISGSHQTRIFIGLSGKILITKIANKLNQREAGPFVNERLYHGVGQYVYCYLRRISQYTGKTTGGVQKISPIQKKRILIRYTPDSHTG